MSVITIPSVFYPMRPMNGGRLDLCSDKGDKWVYDIKVNGFRALVDRRKKVYNRTMGILSIHKLVEPLLEDLPELDWLDCEVLERRGTGKGILIVLDAPTVDGDLLERREAFKHLPVLPLTGYTPPGVYCLPEPMSEHRARHFWSEWDTPDSDTESRLIEGLVAKKVDSKYICQRVSASKESTKWIKHRFSNNP